MTIAEHEVVINPEAFDFYPQLMTEIARGLESWVVEKKTRFMDGGPYAKVGGEFKGRAVVPLWITGEEERQLFQLEEIGNALTHTEEGYPRRTNTILYVFPYLEGRADKITRVRPEVQKDEYDSAIGSLVTQTGDRRLVEGETVYAEMFAEAIAGPGHASKVLMLDPHSALVHRYMQQFVSEVLTLTAVPLFAEKLRTDGLVDENTAVLAPDFGALNRAGYLAELLGLPLVLCDKWHLKHNDSKVTLKYGDVRGKRLIGIDEVVDTAGTITEGSNVLVKTEGAKEVIVLSTGAKLTGPAVSRIDKAFREGSIRKVIFSDSLPSAYKGQMLGEMGFEMIHIGPLLLNGIKTLLDDRATFDTYGIRPYILPNRTPLQAYEYYQKKFDLPPLDS